MINCLSRNVATKLREILKSPGILLGEFGNATLFTHCYKNFYEFTTNRYEFMCRKVSQNFRIYALLKLITKNKYTSSRL